MKWTVPLLLLAALAASVADAAAREWRGCRAEIKIAGHGRQAVVWAFEGRGSCRNRAHANDCRRAAKGAIEFCIKDSWARRWDRRLSGGCVTTSGSSRPHVKGIHNTSFGRGPGAQGDQDFKWAVERAACCQLFRDRDQVTFTVGGSSTGDKGCGPHPAEFFDFTVEGAYVANCRRFRNRGYCG